MGSSPLAPSSAELKAARIARHGEENDRKLARARVGIAGLGGLGSAVAFHLARLGVGSLVLVDFDVVEVSNLHRQQYSIEHVGSPKTEALALQLREIDPSIALETHQRRIDAHNATQIFAGCDIVCEALDDAEQKALLIETLLAEQEGTIVVSGSGMAGFGSANSITTSHPLARLYVCGDQASDVEIAGSLASSRVGVCAAHQAHMIARLILGQVEP